MTLQCKECGSQQLRITNQSYTKTVATESYACEDCDERGSLLINAERGESELFGCLGSTRLQNEQ